MHYRRLQQIFQRRTLETLLERSLGAILSAVPRARVFAIKNGCRNNQRCHANISTRFSFSNCLKSNENVPHYAHVLLDRPLRGLLPRHVLPGWSISEIFWWKTSLWMRDAHFQRAENATLFSGRKVHLDRSLCTHDWSYRGILKWHNNFYLEMCILFYGFVYTGLEF